MSEAAERAFAAGLEHQHAGRIGEAEAAYREVLSEQPDSIGALHNLGNLLRVAGNAQEAAELLKRALALRPGDPGTLRAVADATYNAGFALQGRSEYEGALECYAAILSALPEHAEAKWGRAICLLGQGDYEQGWPAYEMRLDEGLAVRIARKPSLPIPMWQGEPLAGKRILLIGEQGAGDQIQFIRYAKLLSEHGAEVDLLTDAKLVRLLARADGVRRAISVVTDISGYAFWSMLLSLPRAMKTTLDTVPARVPYLRPEAADVEKWERRLRTFGARSPKIGIAWRSGPAKHEWMQQRSIALSALQPLAAVRHACYVGVQFGANAELGGPPAIHLGGEMGDFADAAALLANLDGLVTVDTYTAHVGGALGLPTWVLLPAAADWRWMRERRDCPWYPTVRLVRQPRAGDWQTAVETVAAELVAR